MKNVTKNNYSKQIRGSDLTLPQPPLPGVWNFQEEIPVAWTDGRHLEARTRWRESQPGWIAR